MAPKKPCITLATDFGLADHFVAVMKGVIATIAPSAAVYDVSHELPAFDVPEAAFVIGQAWRWFPKGTVHIVVVDPGVGSARRPIVVEAVGHLFVAPDNGVLSYILSRERCKTRLASNPKYMLPAIGTTFHGRDIFAPIGAHIAWGIKPSSMGKLIDNALRLALPEPMQISKRQWAGSVLKVDRFGNCITSFHLDTFPWLRSSPFEIAIGFEQVTDRATYYAECTPGLYYAVEGSSGYIEIVLREESAAKRLGVVSGSPVQLTGK